MLYIENSSQIGARFARALSPFGQPFLLKELGRSGSLFQ